MVDWNLKSCTALETRRRGVAIVVGRVAGAVRAGIYATICIRARRAHSAGCGWVQVLIERASRAIHTWVIQTWRVLADRARSARNGRENAEVTGRAIDAGIQPARAVGAGGTVPAGCAGVAIIVPRAGKAPAAVAKAAQGHVSTALARHARRGCVRVVVGPACRAKRASAGRTTASVRARGALRALVGAVDVRGARRAVGATGDPTARSVRAGRAVDARGAVAKLVHTTGDTRPGTSCGRHAARLAGSAGRGGAVVRIGEAQRTEILSAGASGVGGHKVAGAAGHARGAGVKVIVCGARHAGVVAAVIVRSRWNIGALRASHARGEIAVNLLAGGTCWAWRAAAVCRGSRSTAHIVTLQARAHVPAEGLVD